MKTSIVCLCLFLLFACKPASVVPAHLKGMGSISMSADDNGELYVRGTIANIGGAVAYDGRIVTIINDGQTEYSLFLGDFEPGETKDFKQVLYSYYREDDVSVKFRTEWRNNS